MKKIKFSGKGLDVFRRILVFKQNSSSKVDNFFSVSFCAKTRKKESWCENLDKRMCGLNYIQYDFSLFKTIVSFALV